MLRVVLVSATTEDEHGFHNTSLGKSLLNLNTPVERCVFFNNKKGLSEVYNLAINSCINSPSVLLFVHDDVTITDYYWVSRILEQLQYFHIVGVAGNKRHVPYMPGWSFIDTNFTYDDNRNLSGAWGDGHTFPPNRIFEVGPPRQEVKLLDGMLLAGYSETLIQNQVYFDEQFDFHYYDLDFCRTASSKGLKLGTADLFVVHGKKVPGLGYNDPNCIANYKKYINKWGN